MQQLAPYIVLMPLILFLIIRKIYMPKHYRDHIESLFEKKEDAYKFAHWCFGDGFEEIHQKELPDRWNLIHGDKLKIKPDENIEECLKKMFHLYKNQIEIWK